MKVSQLDGALLLVLREVLRTGKASAAAERLGLSQSAVSHALSRLRALFDDPLFVRKAHGLEATPRARELAPRVDALLQSMSAALGTTRSFDPALSDRGFRIGAPDHVASLLAPGLMGAAERMAPCVQFGFSLHLGAEALSALRRHDIDVALGRFRRREPGFVGEPLFEDHYCLVARRGHPGIDGELTSAGYAQLAHVQVSVAGDLRTRGIELVSDRGPKRRVVATVPRFLMALTVAAQTDVVAVVPELLARRHAPELGLEVHALPFPAQTIRVLALRRPEPDAGVDWLLATLRAVLP